jgi:hypothetical protein
LASVQINGVDVGALVVVVSCSGKASPSGGEEEKGAISALELSEILPFLLLLLFSKAIARCLAVISESVRRIYGHSRRHKLGVQHIILSGRHSKEDNEGSKRR